MKFLGRLLVVLGIAALVPAGWTAYRDISRAKRHDAAREELLARREKVRDELHDVALELRGYRESIPAMPDSVKMAMSGVISRKLRDYNKHVGTLESRDRELTRRMTREEARKAEVLANTWWISGGIAAGGVLLLAVGIGLTRRAPRGRVSG